MTVRNVFLSLILSLALTFVVTVLYVFYPIISLVAGGFFKSIFSSEPHTDTIVAVAGGGGGSLWIAVAIALASFLIIFTLLQRRSRRP